MKTLQKGDNKDDDDDDNNIINKIKAIMQTANKAMEEILDGKDLNITQLNHLIYVEATVITKEINGTGECKLETQRLKTPSWVRIIQESRRA